MGQLALAIKDVDGNEDHAQLDAGEIQVEHLQAVSKIDAKAVAGLQPAPGKQQGQAIAARVEIAEGISGAFKFESGLAFAADEGQIEKANEIQRIDDSMG